MLRKIKMAATFTVVTLLIIVVSSGQSLLWGKALPKERQIRTLELYCMPAGEDIEEYRAAVLYANELRKLGLDVKEHPMPYAVGGDYIWRERSRWDMTAWYMTARPERSDPDELLYNGLISTTVKGGYNFYGYINPEMDRLLNAQRAEIDIEKRRELIYKIQEMVADDVPVTFTVHRSENFMYNKKIWDPNSIVDQAGIGLRNYWTFVNAKPLTKTKNMIADYAEEERAINPFYISGVVDLWFVGLIFDRLMRIGPDGLPKPAAAKEVKWLDDVTLQVILREGMKFHDGKPVTAEDVKFTFKAIKSGEAPEYEPFAASIESIEVLSKDKLIFHLKAPNVAFLITSLAKISIAPKHIWEPIIEDLKKKPTEDATMIQRKVPIGSGPFRFVSWRRGEEIVLEAVKDHYNAPKIDRLIFRKVSIPEVELGQLVKGEINFLSDYRGDPSALKKAAEANDSLVWKNCITLGARFFVFNLRRPPYNDKAFRKALAYVVPRKKIRDVVEHGFTTIADSFVSKALEYWHNPKLPQYEYNIEKAKEILANAGYEWDKKGRLYYPEGKKETLKPAWGP